MIELLAPAGNPEALRGADTVDGAREGMHALQQQYAATLSALREAAE